MADVNVRRRAREREHGSSELLVHLLPCSVRCEDGDEENTGEAAAKVQEYFVPTIREAEGGKECSTAEEGCVYTASFRGRPLAGTKVKVPEGYTGVVLQKSRTDYSEVREVDVSSEFSELHYWNLQTLPTADDKLLQALVWNRVASRLHSAVPVQRNQGTTPPLIVSDVVSSV